jgi:hypothetical protein
MTRKHEPEKSKNAKYWEELEKAKDALRACGNYPPGAP